MDIDVDFPNKYRYDVVEYVQGKYGYEKVSQIATFQTLGVKSIVKSVGKTLGFTFQDTNEMTKHIPDKEMIQEEDEDGNLVMVEKKIELLSQLEKYDYFKNKISEDSRMKELFEIGKILEGLPSSTGKHAAGVIIGRKDLMNYMPLMEVDGVMVSQFEKKASESIGMLKMDFLGLQTLDVLAEAQRLIEKETGIPLDFNAIPFDDKDTFEHIFQTGKTGKVFQFESSGMQNLLRRMKPTCMADLCAANAAYRPGPLQFVDEFIEGRNDPSKVEYPTPEYEKIAKETMGILFYQEQIMQIVQAMAGFTLGQADVLRRGIGKKEKKYIDEGRELFVKGCLQLGTADEKTAKYIYSTIEKFANYGFNKSHSDAYGLIAYWCAYLKEHYPECFMAANLTICSHDVERLAFALAETSRMNIPILLPDVRFSSSCFTLESTSSGQKAIRFSLAAIKSVREDNAEKYMQADKRSLFHFLLSLPTGTIRKNQIINLIHAGAFDYLGTRKALCENLDTLLDSVKMLSLLQTMSSPSCLSYFPLPDTQNNYEYDALTKLRKEKEVIQIALSGHPVASVRNLTNNTITLADFNADNDFELSQDITLLGILSDYRPIQTKKGDTMAFATLEDEFSIMDTVFFPRTYEELSDTIEDCLDTPVLITGRLKPKENFDGMLEYSLIVSDVEKVLKQSVSFFVDERDMTEEMIGELTKHNGLASVYVVNTEKKIVEKMDFSVDVSSAVLRLLKQVRCVTKK